MIPIVCENAFRHEEREMSVKKERRRNLEMINYHWYESMP